MYLLIVLEILNGEYEYFSHGVHFVPDDTDPAEYAKEQAKDFYDTTDENFDGFMDEDDDENLEGLEVDEVNEVEDEEEQTSFSFYAGAISVRVHSYHKLTLEEYEVLNRFL